MNREDSERGLTGWMMFHIVCVNKAIRPTIRRWFVKKWILGLNVCLLSVPVLAQFAGLPIANSAVAPVAGEMRVTAGVVTSDDYNQYGGRISFAPIGRLALFGDVGAIDPDGADVGPSGQAGFQFTLPTGEEKLADVAIRGTVGFGRFDMDGGDLEMKGFTLGALVSRDVKWIAPYVLLGMSFVNTEVDAHGMKESDDETDLALAVGTLLKLTDSFSLFGEYAYVDESFLNAGARWTF